MSETPRKTALADAADVLSDQLRAQLEELAKRLRPHASHLEQRFMEALQSGKSALPSLDQRQTAALRAITPGAAFQIIGAGRPITEFFEQVEYNGRRLAKMHLPSSTIVVALDQYDRILAPVLESLMPHQKENLRWVREQLLFCVILALNNAFYQVREAETQAFYELFRVELESRGVTELLRRFLATLAAFYPAQQARIYLLDERATAWTLGAVAGRGARSNLRLLKNDDALWKRLSRPLCLIGAKLKTAGPDTVWASKFGTLWSVPLSAGKRTWGVMQFVFDREYDWLPRERELLAAAAERCWMAIEKARLVEDLAAREEQVRQLATRMLHVEEAERSRISRELHDEAGQSMLCIRLQLEMMEMSLPPELASQREALQELRKMTEHTIEEIRRLIAALSPSVLEKIGLDAALRQLAARFRQLYPARVRMNLHGLVEMQPEIERIVYRLIQECFNNIAKHSRATAVNLSIENADGCLKLKIEDNGVGFNVKEAFARRESFGLSGMRERVVLLGGSFHIESTASRSVKDQSWPINANGRGTKISIALPLCESGSAAPVSDPALPQGGAASTRRKGSGISDSATQRNLKHQRTASAAE